MKFNTIHSLGSRCQNSEILKHYNYREFSGFFDFMNTSTIKTINHILSDDFKELLKKENTFTKECNVLTFDPETGEGLPTSLRTVNSFYDPTLDMNNALFPHHNLNNEKDRNHFINCRNRFKKLKNYNTLFNYTYNVWENSPTIEQLEEMVNIIRDVHKINNFKICFIELNKGSNGGYSKIKSTEFYDIWSLIISNNSFTGGLFSNQNDNFNYINIIKSYDINEVRVTKQEIDNTPYVDDNSPQLKKISFTSVSKFEEEVSKFFGSKYAVAVDSCTHGIELCLRHTKETKINVPKRTYISIPFLAEKLGLDREWRDEVWEDYYTVNYGEKRIIDAAVLWRKNSYIPNTFMCVSFQFQKHLSLGRGGMILLDDKNDYINLKKMSYDGRLPDIPWRDQDIDCIGFHYYMTPETAQLGLDKLQEAIETTPKKWVYVDWPDLTEMTIFKK